MGRDRALVLAAGLFVLAQGAGAGAECTPSNEQVFVLGSSFSWDALPPSLDNDPVWHIFCGRPLVYIFGNPYGHCEPTSTPWPGLLNPPGQTYDYVSFQPIPVEGSTQQQDIDTISYWLAGQPRCTTAVIHANWPAPEATNWEAYVHETDPDPDFTLTGWSIEYYYDLREKLRQANPGRRFVLTRGNEMLDHVFHDADAPVPFLDLFRDTYGPMSYGPGRYLQHNAFRQAMGQPTGVDSTVPGVDPVVKAYLDEVVALYPPVPPVPSLGSPGLAVLAAGLAGVAAFLLARRWAAARGTSRKGEAGGSPIPR